MASRTSSDSGMASFSAHSMISLSAARNPTSPTGVRYLSPSFDSAGRASADGLTNRFGTVARRETARWPRARRASPYRRPARKSSARAAGQASTHTGFSPTATRSIQPSHFTECPLRDQTARSAIRARQMTVSAADAVPVVDADQPGLYRSVHGLGGMPRARSYTGLSNIARHRHVVREAGGAEGAVAVMNRIALPLCIRARGGRRRWSPRS